MRLVLATATLSLLIMPWSIAGAAEAEDPFANFKPSPLTVAITVCEAGSAGQRRILVDFDFKNPTRREERLEKWLALHPNEVTVALLHVSRSDGTRIPYIGRHINRGHRIGAASYLRIPAKGTRVVKDVDVTTVYDWPKAPQTLTISYEAITTAHGALQLLRSGSQSLDYFPPSP
jgi:hypothetical protein